jgi:dipeptidyl aminopeptidase/acylaminoacyl peptidase
MKLRWTALLLALTCVPWSAFAAKVTVDDLMKLSSISDVRISPDGKRVAYVVSTPSLERAEHVPVLYVVAAEGGTPLRMTRSTQIFNKPLPAPCLRWSPDGSLITFLGFVGDVPQVMAIAIAGGEAWPLTHAAEGVGPYEWAPDGKRIAYLAPDPVSKEVKERKKDKSYVIQVDRDDRRPRLWVLDLQSNTAAAISAINQTVVDFGWSPDSQTIAYAGSDRKGFYARFNQHLYTVSPQGGTPRAIVDRPGTNKTPRYSPDGKWIAFISTGGYGGMIAAEDLHIVAADGRTGSIRNLTGAKEAWIGEYAWAPDSRALFYISNEDTSATGEHMFEQPIYRVWLNSGQIETLTAGPVANFSVSVSKDGKKLAYKSVESRTMGDVVVMSLADKRVSHLTEINPQLRELELGELKPIHWKSFDKKEIWGLLLTPPGYRGGTRLPAVVYCHGGPIGGFTYGIFPQFMHIPGQVDPYPSEAMASAGMAILFPMPRGGSGYGIAGFKEIIKAWGEGDYKDIMAGVDYLIDQGIADPERLGVMGASYGGFMTSWIVTQTGRFKAASTGASVNDLITEYYLSDAGDFLIEYYGYPWEAGESLIKHSPITYAGKVTTPLLIQHGEEDHRVPVEQAWEFYRALEAQNKTVEFDIYPRGGHVNFEPPLERQYMLRNLEWFKHWLKVDVSSQEEKVKTSEVRK